MIELSIEPIERTGGIKTNAPRMQTEREEIIDEIETKTCRSAYGFLNVEGVFVRERVTACCADEGR